TMSAALVNRITLRGRQRIARVLDPDSGKSHSHGLGETGEPILPYLGPRAEGYRVAFPGDIRAIQLYRIYLDEEPNERGYFPKGRTSWADVDAPDICPAEKRNEEGNK